MLISTLYSGPEHKVIESIARLDDMYKKVYMRLIQVLLTC